MIPVASPPPSPVDAHDAAWLASHKGWLKGARPLPLTAVPQSDAALALTGTLAGEAMARAAAAGRSWRRAVDREGFTAAVGAVVGGLLGLWMRRTACPGRRSVRRDAFTGEAVSFRHFAAATDALIGLGYVDRQASSRWSVENGAMRVGKAGCLWPTTKLLDAAAAAGVGPETVATDFRKIIPVTVPKIGELVIVKTLTTHPGESKDRRKKLPVSALGSVADAVVADVAAANEFAAQFVVVGCRPPRWFRVFNGDVSLGGRWIAAGVDGPYQTMSADDRRTLTIGGEPVAEIDVSGSQVTLLHGLLGMQLPAGDLYDVPGFPRDVVKQWTMQAIGNGTVPRKWSPKTPSAHPARQHDIQAVGAAVCARLPLLGNLEDAVGRLGLDKLATRLDVRPSRLLVLRLQNREARAIGVAMRMCRSADILALPVHDSLIVPVSRADEAKANLVEAYRDVCGIEPATKTKLAPVTLPVAA
jgi:hypothetical protein